MVHLAYDWVVERCRKKDTEDLYCICSRQERRVIVIVHIRLPSIRSSDIAALATDAPYSTAPGHRYGELRLSNCSARKTPEGGTW